jgi:hypothetical protein
MMGGRRGRRRTFTVPEAVHERIICRFVALGPLSLALSELLHRRGPILIFRQPTKSGARMRSRWGMLSVVALILAAQPARAQQPAAPQPEVGPKIGELAPDFEFTGITRYGKLAEAKKLSDFRGQTVVIAFFPKARTRG